MPVYRKAKTRPLRAIRAKKRMEAADAIPGIIGKGKYDIDDIFRTGGCCFGTTGNRCNRRTTASAPRRRFKNGDPFARDIVATPKTQRSPGILARMAASPSEAGAPWRRACFGRYFLPSAHYKTNALENDTPRNMEERAYARRTQRRGTLGADA